MKIQLENENKRPFENWTEKSKKITKTRNGGLKKNPNPIRKCR